VLEDGVSDLMRYPLRIPDFLMPLGGGQLSEMGGSRGAWIMDLQLAELIIYTAVDSPGKSEPNGLNPDPKANHDAPSRTRGARGKKRRPVYCSRVSRGL
jgi:hypothetical protein